MVVHPAPHFLSYTNEFSPEDVSTYRDKTYELIVTRQCTSYRVKDLGVFFKRRDVFLKRPDVFKKRLGEFEFCLRVKIFGVGGKVRCRMFHHLLVSEVLMFR